MALGSSRSVSVLVVAGFGAANWALISLGGCGTDSQDDSASKPKGGRSGASGNSGAAGTSASGSAGVGPVGAGGQGGNSGGGNAGSSAGGAGGSTGGSSGGSNTGGSAGVGGNGGTGSGGTAGRGGANGTGSGGAIGSGGTGASGGTNGAGGSAGASGSGGISTDANLKIAFIGDTSTGSGYRTVLTLVKNEQAAALVVQGDMSYSANPTDWWNVTEEILGTTFPVFISRGNHDDSSWSGYLPKAQAHLGGATREAGAHDANYKTTFRGLVIATIRKGDTGTNISRFLQNEAHIWKVCQWHQNQEALQVGDKSDEMGWDVYETCRRLGAIVQTGHEHSYSRTKTLSNIQTQTVDPSCGNPAQLCVGLGRTFVNVVGLGGNSVRDQTRCLPATAPYGCNGEWASIYTVNQNAIPGAQFITFNAGDPRRAVGYFKNVTGTVMDNFTISYGP
jgi:hypothetical protein